MCATVIFVTPTPSVVALSPPPSQSVFLISKAASSVFCNRRPRGQPGNQLGEASKTQDQQQTADHLWGAAGFAPPPPLHHFCPKVGCHRCCGSTDDNDHKKLPPFTSPSSTINDDESHVEADCVSRRRDHFFHHREPPGTTMATSHGGCHHQPPLVATRLVGCVKENPSPPPLGGGCYLLPPLAAMLCGVGLCLSMFDTVGMLETLMGPMKHL
ncbi:unnamed protein product [Lactuca saligna]|uniref:Uncharacterized protein n=1 Tax=Lactuca saligna TaxID=75948 RepID=A0AA35V8H4_LACSI|nr:unnamed protein product [Lactuca saligna]